MHHVLLPPLRSSQHSCVLAVPETCVLQPSRLTCPLLCWGRLFPPFFQNRLQDGQLYAFKGLSGRLGPIGVHIALLMCLFGTGPEVPVFRFEPPVVVFPNTGAGLLCDKLPSVR